MINSKAVDTRSLANKIQKLCRVDPELMKDYRKIPLEKLRDPLYDFSTKIMPSSGTRIGFRSQGTVLARFSDLFLSPCKAMASLEEQFDDAMDTYGGWGMVAVVFKSTSNKHFVYSDNHEESGTFLKIDAEECGTRYVSELEHFLKSMKVAHEID